MLNYVKGYNYFFFVGWLKDLYVFLFKIFDYILWIEV